LLDALQQFRDRSRELLDIRLAAAADIDGRVIIVTHAAAAHVTSFTTLAHMEVDMRVTVIVAAGWGTGCRIDKIFGDFARLLFGVGVTNPAHHAVKPCV
jgi:hypothetical protein